MIHNSYIKNQSSDPWEQGKINRMPSRALDHSIIRSKDSQNCKMWQLRVHFDKNLIIESQLLICFLESPESILAPRENRTSGKIFFLYISGSKDSQNHQNGTFEWSIDQIFKVWFFMAFSDSEPFNSQNFAKKKFLSYMAQPGPGLRKFSTKTVKSSFEVI